MKGILSSKWFSVSEFACDSGEAYPVDWIDSRLQKLVDALDCVRDEWGGPIVVVSGYRTPEYNERLRKHSSGVAEHSQHVVGTAADVAPVPRTRENVLRLNRVVERLIGAGRLPGLGGIGIYPLWVHIDVRGKPADGHIARWIGAGFGSEPIT